MAGRSCTAFWDRGKTFHARPRGEERRVGSRRVVVLKIVIHCGVKEFSLIQSNGAFVHKINSSERREACEVEGSSGLESRYPLWCNRVRCNLIKFHSMVHLYIKSIVRGEERGARLRKKDVLKIVIHHSGKEYTVHKYWYLESRGVVIHCIVKQYGSAIRL